MIYLITRGEYSDYGVVGYCTSKNIAEKICAKLNRMELQRVYSIPYMVESCRCMDEKPKAESVAYEYEFHAIKDISGKVEMTYPYSAEGVLVDEWLPVRVEPDVIKDPATGIGFLVSETYTIRVRVKQKNRDKALKIAEDALAQYRAEEEEKNEKDREEML